MFKYFLKRLGLMLITFAITVFLFFVFIKLIPLNKPEPVPGQDLTWWYKLVEREGWDKPIPVQFGIWLKNIFVYGNFGFSLHYKRDVAEVYFGRIPATVKINLIPYILSIPIAISVGVFAALKKNKLPDHIISILIMIFISVPYFVIVLLSQYLFYFKWKIAPDYKIASTGEIIEHGFWYGAKSYIFPVILLTITGIPGLARSVRAELTEQLTQDYILLARSKGLTKKQATYRHALKNAMVPFLPGIFIGIITVISGGMITEKLFRVNGTGDIYLTAFTARDYQMLMLITVFNQFLTLLVGIISDLSYTLFDPRVRVGGGRQA